MWELTHDITQKVYVHECVVTTTPSKMNRILQNLKVPRTEAQDSLATS